MSKTVTALDTISGQVGVVPALYLTHPVLGVNLVEVEPGTKSYEPTKYKPQSADEYRASHKGNKKSPAKEQDEGAVERALPASGSETR